MKKSYFEKSIQVEIAEELGEAPGLSKTETGDTEFRSDLTCALAKIIRYRKMTHAEIAKKGGASRTRVTAIANSYTNVIFIEFPDLILLCSAPGLAETGKLLKYIKHQHYG